jgi:hypothetical protein
LTFISRLQPWQISDRPPDGDSFDACNGADDLEIHAGIIVFPQSSVNKQPKSAEKGRGTQVPDP